MRRSRWRPSPTSARENASGRGGALGATPLPAAFDVAAVPLVGFSDPEIAPVGLTEAEARAATDRVGGVHVVGPHASELAAQGTLAIEMMASPQDLPGTIHPHPTISEGLHEAAEILLGHPIHVGGTPDELA